jgi:DNA-binding response OmpR family regulator
VRLTDFRLLLLEDDPDCLDLLAQAARETGLAHHLHTLRDGDEAVGYFKRLIATARPLSGIRIPSLFLVSLEGPAGLPVLEWLNREPRLRRMVKVGLHSRPETLSKVHAYDLGLNSCLVRPLTPAERVAMFKSIGEFWGALNHPSPG